MEPADIKYIDTEIFSCDGGDGPLGHPRVYLNMEGRGQIDCPYCGCRYILTQDEGLSGHPPAESASEQTASGS